MYTRCDFLPRCHFIEHVAHGGGCGRPAGSRRRWMCGGGCGRRWSVGGCRPPPTLGAGCGRRRSVGGCRPPPTRDPRRLRIRSPRRRPRGPPRRRLLDLGRGWRQRCAGVRPRRDEQRLRRARGGRRGGASARVWVWGGDCGRAGAGGGRDGVGRGGRGVAGAFHRRRRAEARKKKRGGGGIFPGGWSVAAMPRARVGAPNMVQGIAQKRARGINWRAAKKFARLLEAFAARERCKL